MTDSSVIGSDLALAYSMLHDFKLGKLETGQEISDEQIRLISILGKDLLPNEVFLNEHADQTLIKTSQADTYWNHATQELISKCYDLKSENNPDEVQKIKDSFFSRCPSIWYKNIIKSI